MEGFCRSCLVKYDEPTDLMPYSEKNRRMFVYATGLQAKRNDTFTFQLCKECYLNMKVACNFKKTSRNSDKKFKSYLACREAGDTVDFCTFLKNNDESLKFRLPMYNDNSTPANRNRDDDVESTCTSIQNFMTDILKSEDIPDIEARIIKEVIEEEADILDDSLDSHWLQDDISIDTDLKMDFSFSPFATPRSTIDDDHCYTPKRLNDPTAIRLENNNQVNRVDNLKLNVVPQDCETLKDCVKGSDRCVIDMNLENALKNDSTKKVMLDELISTPPVVPNVSAISTPLINNILFGDKIDIDSENNQKNVYMPPNMIKQEEIDVLYEFFQTNNEKEDIIEEYYDDIYMQEDVDENNRIDDAMRSNDNVKKYLNLHDENKNQVEEDIKEPSSPVEDKYCLETFYCKICERRFKNMLAIKAHFRRCHKIRIVTVKPKRVRRKMICDYCGKLFMSPQCIVRHIQNHMKPDQFHCEHCPLSFRTENGLKSHRSTHGIAYQRDNIKTRKKYVCKICGSVQSSSSNYSVHLRRHARKYAMSCAFCGKGFYRTSDLDTHMRVHTGERPFACMYCPSKFARQDVLNRHIKSHTGEKPYVCPICNGKFLNAAILKKHRLNCKACLEKQMEILIENSDQNKMNNVTVHYINVPNNGEVSNNEEVSSKGVVSNNGEVSKNDEVFNNEEFNNGEVSNNEEESNNGEVSNDAEILLGKSLE